MRAQRVVLTFGLIGVLCTAASGRALHAQQGSAKADSAALFNEAVRLTDAGEALDVFAVVDSQRKAIALLRQAEPLYRKSGAQVHLMYLEYSIARRFNILGNVDTAEIYSGSSLKLARALGLQANELSLLVFRGQVRDYLGRPDSARADFLQARNLGAILGDHSNDRVVDIGLGHSFHDLARPDSALPYYRAALTAQGDSLEPGEIAEVYNGLGRAFADLGQADSAITSYRQALAIRRRLGDHALEARALQNIGLVFNNIGQPDSALFYHRQALPMERQAGDRQAEAATLLNIGSVLKRMDMLDSSLAYLRLALPIYREIGDVAGEGMDLQNLGAIFQDGGLPDSALAYLREAVRVSRRAGDRVSEAIGLDNIGMYYLARGEADSALIAARGALGIDREVGDRAGEVLTLAHLGKIFRRQRLLDSATAYFERSTILAGVVSKQTGNDFNQLHYNEINGDIYALWARTWLDRVKLGDTLRAIRASLAVTERGRAQALLNLMGTSRELRPGADLPAEGYALAEQALDHAAAALVYSVAGDTVLTWLLLPGGVIHTVVDSVPRGRLDMLVAGLRYGVAQEDAIAERGGRITRGGSQMLDPLDQRVLTPNLMAYAKADRGLRLRQELSALLLPPEITDFLPASGELLIIPQGGLGLLPFGLLPIGNDTTLLGDRFAIRYGPSLTAVAEAEARPGLNAGSDRAKQLAPALIVGDPAMPAPFALDGEHYVFDPLPSARLEGKAVADSLGAQWLSGTQATEAAVRAAIPDARLIHLATHGLVYSSDAHSRLSFVALAPDATHDGHLSVAKIVDSLTFKAELVVLSACQTAVGNVTSAEGTLGLQRAVLAKGARSVLVSLWNVPDESTLFLIERFYHHWLHDPNSPSKSEALRLAQADVRAEAARTAAHRDWADPFYWAAFQLVGAP